MRRYLAPVVLALAVMLASGPVMPAAAQDVCDGTVVGLSRNYNPQRGSGFLAVRSGPGTRYRQIGELFNGDQVGIWDRSGSWYHIYVNGIGEGWAHTRWIRNSCRY